MKHIIFIILFILFSQIISSQKPNYFKRLYIDAEYFILYKEYKESLPLFLELNSHQPENMNIAYRVGECYLNIPNSKHKALYYLKKANKEISINYKPGFYDEMKAPKEAIYMLGIALRIDGQIDSAINKFNEYRKLLIVTEIDKKLKVDMQIKACNTAIEMMKSPIQFTESNIGRYLNNSFANIKPIVCTSDTLIAFITKLRFYDAVFFAKKKDGKWQRSLNLTPYLGSDGDLSTCFFGNDGNAIYLKRYDWDNSNLYVSNSKKGKWGNIEKMDKTINSKFNETHLCITYDNNKLYFVSDRPGGIGGKDIYESIKDDDGEWGTPVILGKEINTRYDEETPFITENGTLYFSSQGHNNMGGFDIFYSKNETGKWSKPTNIGYPINTTDDDIHFMPINNGRSGYYSLYRSDGNGNSDIYKIVFE